MIDLKDLFFLIGAAANSEVLSREKWKSLDSIERIYGTRMIQNDWKVFT